METDLEHRDSAPIKSMFAFLDSKLSRFSPWGAQMAVLASFKSILSTPRVESTHNYVSLVKSNTDAAKVCGQLIDDYVFEETFTETI